MKVKSPFQNPNKIDDRNTRSCVSDLAKCGENHAHHIKALLQRVEELEARLEEIEQE